MKESKEDKNPNHPKKGSNITVEPIRNENDIKMMKKYLKDNSRDLLLFTLGINNGLRISDLLALKVSQVKDLKCGDTVKIREQKTKKDNIIGINKTTEKVLHQYLKESASLDHDYLFPSRNGDNNPLKKETVHKMIKTWTNDLRIKGNFGTHSLRKTWGYHQRVKHGVGFEILCKRFGHSSPAITMRYLGITSQEVNDVLMNEI